MLFNMGHRINRQKQLPISAYQKRFFFEWALAPDENSYNLSLIHSITGSLDEKAFKNACEVFIGSNEVVQAQYSTDGEECYYGDFDIADFYHELVFDSKQPIQSQIKKFLYKPFDLTKGPLLRLYLLKSDDKNKPEFYFFFVAHHIIGDAIFILQLYDQISNAYKAISKGDEILLNVDKTFTQAVEAEQNILNKSYKAKAQQFWLDFIGELSLNIGLPYRSDAAAINLEKVSSDKTGEFIYFELSISESSRLRACAKERGSTLFIVLSSLYSLVLSKYINQEKFFFSYPVNTRPERFAETPGCFVNNIPLKLELDEVDTLSQLIEILGDQRRAVKPYQGYSLVDIINDQRKYGSNETSNAFNIGFGQSHSNVIHFELSELQTIQEDIINHTSSIYEIGLLYDDHSIVDNNLCRFDNV